jgi:hypothetical protein
MDDTPQSNRLRKFIRSIVHAQHFLSEPIEAVPPPRGLPLIARLRTHSSSEHVMPPEPPPLVHAQTGPNLLTALHHSTTQWTQSIFYPTEPTLIQYPVGDDQLERAKRYAKFAAAAYCVSKKRLRTWSCHIHHAEHDKDTVRRRLQRHVTVHRVFEPFCTAARGYVATDDHAKEILVAFRGTLVLQNALHDLRVYPTPFRHGAGNVHAGFNITADSVFGTRVLPTVMHLLQQHHYREYRVVVTGHSLGGAVALIVAVRLMSHLPPHTKVSCFTFGAPRVGDAAFIAHVQSSGMDELVRVVHDGDWVPSHPIEKFGYRHHGTVWRVTKHEQTLQYPSPEGDQMEAVSSWIKNPLDHLKVWGVNFGPWCPP